jgi:hypothetical protein
MDIRETHQTKGLKMTIDLSRPTGAIFSEDHLYRYALWRKWDKYKPLLMFIGLNPSVASAEISDATITRMKHRAESGGFGGLLVGNLFAFVSTIPNALLKCDAVGVETDNYLSEMINSANIVMCGWGSFPAAKVRAKIVLPMIPEPYCLGVNPDGQPKHPLYIGYDKPMIKYEVKE